MSTTGMKTQQKKRKLDEISNTKPAVAKSLKAKLAETQSKLDVEVVADKMKATAAAAAKKQNNLNKSTASVPPHQNESTMIDTNTTDKKKQQKDKSNAKKNRVSAKDPAMQDDSFDAEKENQRKATSSAKQGSSSNKNNNNKKVLTDQSKHEIEHEDNEEIQLSQSHVIIGNMFSLYALAEKQPTKIKTVIDQIFSHNDNSEEFVVKTMFLYFMELMGVSDVETLQYNAQYIARNTEEKKLLELFNNVDDKLEVSFDKLIFFSQEKKQLEQKKLLKKICKIFIANVVDLLPDKASFLSSVIQRVCVYSKASQRLVRYSFTYVGLYLYKFLLGQQSELLKLRKSYENKHKNELKLNQHDEAKKVQRRIDSINSAMSVISTNLQTIQQHIILKRQLDTTPLVRKSVFEFLLQLDEKEIQIAFSSSTSEKSGDLYKMVFGALTDSDSQIKKIAINMVYNILTKTSSPSLGVIGDDTDDSTQKEIVQNLEKHKLDIFKLSIPTEKHQDTVIIVRSLQVIQKMIQMIPDIYNNDNKQMLANLVHYKNQQVREEIGELLLIISDEFDESLLDLQKINPSKGVPESFVLNFNENPGKSRKQLLKLIQVFEKHIQTRSQYINQHKRDEGTDELIVPNMGQEDVKKILSCDCEERAALMFQTFMRKTSILYDVQSIVALLKRDDIDEDTKVVLSNLIHIALTFTLTMKNTKDSNHLIYQKLWENQSAYLKLTVMNELMQTFRVQSRILEPLLKSLLTLSKTIEKDNKAEINDELGKDFAHLLLRIIDDTDVNDQHPESLQIIKASIINLASLQIYFPLMRKEIQNLGLNFCDELQNQVIPKLFNIQQQQQQYSQSQSNQINTLTKHNNQSQSQLEHFSFLQKFNVLMTQLSIQQISDSEHLKSLTAFVVVNFGQMILENYHIVSKYNVNQFKCILQIPFSFIDQLFCDNQVNKQHLEFQQKMMSSLMDFYMDLHKQFKGNEPMQVVILKFIVESLIIASGENRLANDRSTANAGCVVMSLNDFPRVKDLLIDTIQNVSGRLKGNELVIQEQFQILFNLFMRDFQALLSETGVEFLINFGTSKDPVVSSCIRKLYYTYKQRDRLYDQKKSIFYQFILKIIYAIYQSTDTKIYKLSEQVPGDLEKERLSLGLDDLKIPISLQTYQKLAFIQQFLKTFHNSIMLLLINPKSVQAAGQNSSAIHSNGLTKQQDELAYFKLIEGIIRLSLQDKPRNLPLLLTIKYLMHKNFLQAKQQEGTLKGLKSYVESNKDALGITHDEHSVISCLIKLIEDKVRQKVIVPVSANVNVTTTSGGNKGDTSNITLDQQDIDQSTTTKVKGNVDATMNLSLTNHNIVVNQITPQKQDDVNGDESDADEKPDQEQIDKFNREAAETKQQIGKKRRAPSNNKKSRGSSRVNNNNNNKSRDMSMNEKEPNDEEFKSEVEDNDNDYARTKGNRNDKQKKQQQQSVNKRVNSDNNNKQKDKHKQHIDASSTVSKPQAKPKQTSSNPRKKMNK